MYIEYMVTLIFQLLSWAFFDRIEIIWINIWICDITNQYIADN